MMNRSWFFFVYFITFFISTCYGQSCVLYDTCSPLSPAPNVGKKAPCVNYTSPLSIVNDTQFIDQLSLLCGSDTPAVLQQQTCCTRADFLALQSQLALAQTLLQSCPACLFNFRRLWCELSCSPFQSQFLQVVSSVPAKSPGKRMVTDVIYRLDSEFADTLFTSCDSLTLGMSNTRVWEFLYSGFLPRSGQELLDRLGQPTWNDGNSPYLLEFQLINGTSRMDLKGVHCDAPGPMQCTCADCRERCVPPEQFEENEWDQRFLGDWQKTCRIGAGRVPCSHVILVLSVYGSVLFLIVFVTVLFKRWKVNNSALAPPVDPIPVNETEPNESEPLLAPTVTDLPIYPLDSIITNGFYQIGRFFARHTTSTLFVTLFLVSHALVSLLHNPPRLLTEPLDLWVSPTAQSAQEKQYFDQHFGPFYRTQQIIFKRRDHLPLLSDPQAFIPLLRAVFEMEQNIQLLNVSYALNISSAVMKEQWMEVKWTQLEALCYRALPGACMIQSLTRSYENKSHFEMAVQQGQWLEIMERCLSVPTSCLYTSSSTPLQPNLILGGSVHLNESTSLIITYLLDNRVTGNSAALAFEEALRNIWKQGSFLENNPIYVTSYSTESALEKELAKDNDVNAITIAASYFVMFLYVSLSLGYRSWHRFYQQSRPLLALTGLFLVVGALICAVWICCQLQWPATLIIAEVIPFLVLAVGVDNLFLMVHALDEEQEKAAIESTYNNGPGLTATEIEITASQEDLCLSIEDWVAKAVAKVGPSMLVAAVGEAMAFSLGALVSMPAVSAFAAYAAIAILCDFVLQITCFVSVLCWDTKRRLLRHRAVSATSSPSLHWMNVYAIWLLKWRHVWFAVWCVSCLCCLVSLNWFQWGLDQRVALPRSSHLIDYFNDIESELLVGPPLYFIVQSDLSSDSLSQSSLQGQQRLASKYFQDLDEHSIGTLLEINRHDARNAMAQPVSIWMDDYLTWLATCCYVDEQGQFCNRTQRSDCEDLQRCFKLTEEMMEKRLLTLAPHDQDFMKYLPTFMSDSPDAVCPVAGGAAYSSAIAIRNGSILASQLRTFHPVLRTQDEFVGALMAARRLAERLTFYQPKMPVFAYSLFYVFFEQYLTLSRELGLLLALAAFLLGCWMALALGHIVMSLIALLMISSMTLHVAAVMPFIGAQMNTLTVVNLLMTCGMAVEFTVHYCRAYLITDPTLDALERARLAMNRVGSALLRGILLTKLTGVLVLAFSPSPLFLIYYCGVYAAVVVMGALHCLIYVPVFVTMIAPKQVKYRLHS